MTESGKKTKRRACFGNLDTVFPVNAIDELRRTPETCRACEHKTPCLREALDRPSGIKVHEERVDREYAAGRLSFFQRWSKRKTFDRLKNRMEKEQK